MASMLLHEALKPEHALRNGKRACPCCTGVGNARNTRSRARDRRSVMRRQRQVEDRQWRSEQY